jgi:hypothetical protein
VAPTHQCTGAIERRILGCSSNQQHRAALYVREQRILLRFVKPVNFVDKKYRWLYSTLGLGDQRANLRDSHHYS